MIKSILIVSVLLGSFSASAWGPIGHQTIANIAEAQLSPTARDAVKKLFGDKSLADWANWADEIRGSGKYPATGPYHYERANDGYKFLDYEQWLSKSDRQRGGVVDAILASNDILRDGTASQEAQVDALKFLIHFVGDVHQPLHTGRFDDKGGNGLKVNWFGTPSELHRVWDSGMIITGHEDILGKNASPSKAGKVYAKYLMDHFSPPTQIEMEVDKWFDDASALRPDLYESSYINDQARYQAKFLPQLDQLIYSAGIRLGALLNQTFEKKPQASEEMKFQQSLENIVGQLKSFISLRP